MSVTVIGSGIHCELKTESEGEIVGYELTATVVPDDPRKSRALLKALTEGGSSSLLLSFEDAKRIAFAMASLVNAAEGQK